MLPKEDRISYKAMLDIPLVGICYPRKTEYFEAKDIPLPGIRYPRKTEY